MEMIKFVVTISDNMGQHKYTINALSLNEAKETANRKLIKGQALVSVVKDKIQ